MIIRPACGPLTHTHKTILWVMCALMVCCVAFSIYMLVTNA